MKRIGMIVAVEITSVIKRYGDLLEKIECTGYKVYRYQIQERELYVLSCGVGQIAAAAGTQFLIDRFQVEMIVNFGIVGGLTPQMTLIKTCIVENVIHYEFDTSSVDHCEVGRYLHYPDVRIPLNKELIEIAVNIYPELERVTCASGSRFLTSKEEKQTMHETFDADIVEMEAAGIVMTCDRNEVPCLMIKTVSDSIAGGAEEFRSASLIAADTCLNIVNEIIAKGNSI